MGGNTEYATEINRPYNFQPVIMTAHHDTTFSGIFVLHDY